MPHIKHKQPNTNKHTSRNQLTQLFPGLVANIDHTYPKSTHPPNISLVLDGGGFSGSHIVGALTYIDFIARDRRISVDRISGVSIGAICALLFRLDRLDIAFALYPATRNHYTTFTDLAIVSQQLDQIKKIMPPDFHTNCRLWISYFDIKTMKHVTVSKFISNDHLTETVRRSIHVPWLFDRSTLYRDRYLDGLYPHTFALDPPPHTSPKPTSTVIFLNLINLPIVDMFRVRHRTSMLDQATDGALLCHRFFRSGTNNPFCHSFHPLSYRGGIFILRMLITHILVRLSVFIHNSTQHTAFDEWTVWLMGPHWKTRLQRLAESIMRKSS